MAVSEPWALPPPPRLAAARRTGTYPVASHRCEQVPLREAFVLSPTGHVPLPVCPTLPSSGQPPASRRLPHKAYVGPMQMQAEVLRSVVSAERVPACKLLSSVSCAGTRPLLRTFGTHNPPCAQLVLGCPSCGGPLTAGSPSTATAGCRAARRASLPQRSVANAGRHLALWCSRPRTGRKRPAQPGAQADLPPAGRLALRWALP